MAQVEDMARAAGGTGQHVVNAVLKFRPGGQEGDGVEVALDRFVVADLLPAPVERHLPVDADHITATGHYLTHIGAGTSTKVDHRHPSLADCAVKHLVIGLDIPNIVQLAQRLSGP